MAKKKHTLTSIGDLKPASYNPRKIKTQAASGLGESLKRFGDVGGIVWNSRTGNLVCGHQRVEQLRKQGAVLEDGALVRNGERWPVRVVDWTLEREKTANVAANNPHVAGEFSDGLGDILTDIRLSIGDEDFMGLRFDALEGFRAGAGHSRQRVTEWKGGESFLEMPGWLAPVWETIETIVVSYSGGKDSTGAALWAAHHCDGRRLLLCFCDPGVEFPGMSDHVAAVAEFLGGEPEILKSKEDWWVWLREQGWPSLLYRPCAQKFVHAPFSKRVRELPAGSTILLTGSRAEEAVRGSKKTERSELLSLGNRAGEYQHFAPCFSMKKPILEQVIRESKVPVWEGYSRGFVRTACWCCPGQCGAQALALTENYPGLAEDVRRWEKRLGPLQPMNGPKDFDGLVATGRRKREKAENAKSE